MDHSFNGTRFTVGVEEELMIVDGSSFDLVNGVELLLAGEADEHIKPELLESVLEISTDPHLRVDGAAAQLEALRAQVAQRAHGRGFEIGSAGTHPWARWEDQRVVARERYEGLVEALALIARQELLFGLHVHVGIDDPDAAIAVANGLRLQVPVLLALSANSPFWRGIESGLMSTRVPLFRQFPRVGVPPYYADWDAYTKRIAFMVKTGLIADYTYLWFDVRPHPALGTVEIRAMDAQTRLQDTVALTALCQSLAKLIYERHSAGETIPDHPGEVLDESKWLAARYGLDADLVDVERGRRAGARELVRRLLPPLREHATDLGCADRLEGVVELLEAGNGAQRQLAVYRDQGKLVPVMAAIVAQAVAAPQA